MQTSCRTLHCASCHAFTLMQQIKKTNCKWKEPGKNCAVSAWAKNHKNKSNSDPRMIIFIKRHHEMTEIRKVAEPQSAGDQSYTAVVLLTKVKTLNEGFPVNAANNITNKIPWHWFSWVYCLPGGHQIPQWIITVIKRTKESSPAFSMDLGESPWENDKFSGVTRTLGGWYTLSLLTEVGPISASTAVDGCEVDCTCWVCLTERLACACTVGHSVTVDKIGRAVVCVFLFWKGQKGDKLELEHTYRDTIKDTREVWSDSLGFLLHARSLHPGSRIPSAAHAWT